MLFKQVHWIRLIADCSKHLLRRSQISKMSTAGVTSGTEAEAKVEDTAEVKVEDTQDVKGEKRKLESDEVTTSAKREKSDLVTVTEKETCPSLKKRKVALLMSYSGKGYFGLQRQKDFPTIEGTLSKALLSMGVIAKEDDDTPQNIRWQRAARTDKGVSAAANLVSLKISCIRVTKGFDSKNFCNGRTYSYLAPSFAFAPHTQAVTEKYKVEDDTVQRIREIIKKFEGTHNFHNFTSGVKPNAAQAKRYIISFKCGEPFVQDGIEFVQLTVRGQSFMLHHIRKMIGLTMAIVRGHCGEEVIDKSYSLVKVDIPKAPGNGLMLEELHYPDYNRRYGKDGVHQSLDWVDYRETIDKFKEEFIYPEMIRSEREEHSMMTWLDTLDKHDYDEIPPEKLLNWKYSEGEKNNKKEKEKSTASSEKTNCLGEATSEEKDTKSSSAENGKEAVSAQDQTKGTVESSVVQSLTDKDTAETSGEDVPTDTDKSDDKAVNDKDSDKMEVS